MKTSFLILVTLVLAVFGAFLLTSCNPIQVDQTTNNTLVPPNGSSAASASADYTGYCGQELADLKQLRDSTSSNINFNPQDTTIANLTSLSQTETTVRTLTEFNTYTIKVNLDAMRAESDSDIHVGVSDGQGHTMIVEFIAPQCDTGQPQASQIAQARADLFTECGVATSTGFTSLKGQTATITGVAFFDKLHGQFDVAPNGVELHPVLAFSGCGHSPAPPVTNPVTTTNVTDNGFGCKKYPGKHWYHRVYHNYCKSYFNSTE